MPYIPYYGGTLSTAFPLQFPQADINIVSMAVVLVEQFSLDGTGVTISHGTGFMWRGKTSIWLVTARHVFTGKNPFDDTHVSTNLFEPQEIRVHYSVGGLDSPTYRESNVFSLYMNSSPAWADDPQFTEFRTDISALPVNFGRKDIICVNDYPGFDDYENLFTQVGFQCFVIGYPTTAVAGLMLPIWRSGALASDPGVPIDGKPIFLLDAATGPGFSGSPVFRHHFGPAPFHDSSSPTGIRIDHNAVLRSRFVGVYAGRLNHPHVGAQTPYVFYGNRVPVIVSAGSGKAVVTPVR